MSSTQQIRSRIRSVRNTRQITKAMQMVSASKLRRMQEAAQQTRAYRQYAREILTRLRQHDEVKGFEFYTERPIKKRLLIVVTSDRGLAGAYNANVLKYYISELKKDDEAGIDNATIMFGRQGASVVARLKDTEIMGVYTNLPDKPELVNLEAAITTAMADFMDEKVDAVDLIYTSFNSTVSQDVVIQRLLPAGFTDEPVSDAVNQATFEPSVEAVLLNTTVRLIEAQLLQGVIEANVSEQAMRMLAMKSATDNASDLIDAYTLAYNNARQAAITQELAEITGGAEAMK